MARSPSRLSFSFRHNRNYATVSLTALERYDAIGERIERVVAAHTDILAGIVHSATLANDDVAGDASLTTPNLNAQSL